MAITALSENRLIEKVEVFINEDTNQATSFYHWKGREGAVVFGGVASNSTGLDLADSEEWHNANIVAINSATAPTPPEE